MARMKVVKLKQPKQPKVKRDKKPFPKFAFATVAVFAVAALVLIWALPNLPQKPPATAQGGYKGVIELWNVETFEGGSGSRSSWLTARSAKFEAKNTGLFVYVTTLTESELVGKLADGQTFDMVCFSRGVGDVIKQYLAPLDIESRDVKENMLLAGQVDGKQYAAPLYAGAYCLFARTSQLAEQDLLNKALTQTCTRKIGKNTVELQPLICGFTAANSPLTALAMSGGRGDASGINETVTQYQAYEQFVSNKTAVTLLGTQRDMFRLFQRESNGKIEALGFCPLTGYTDLVQFVGVSNSCGNKLNSCMQYVDYLLSAESQQTIVNLSMFSVQQDGIYTDERYAACEKGLSNAFVPRVFVDGEVIANQRQTAKATLRI